MDFLLQDYNYLWLATAMSSGFLLFGPMLRGSADALSPQQAVMLLNRENAVVLDVRDAQEFASGHLLNARNIPAKELPARTGELKKLSKRPLIVVCESGSRSAATLAQLRKAGFEQVFNLAGGIAAWKNAGQPLTRT